MFIDERSKLVENILISCPGNMYTGGPTLAHQLCNVLNLNGIDSKMYYIGKSEKPVHDNYLSFSNPYLTFHEKTEAKTVVILETQTYLVDKIKADKKYIWWMSVDNFFMGQASNVDRFLKKLKIKEFDLYNVMKKTRNKTAALVQRKDVYHLVQSEYARLFLIDNGVPEDKIYHLADYIEDQVVEASDAALREEKKFRVLYNPKKGFKFSKKIIDKMTEVEFVPLIGLNKGQVIDLLKTSSVYIDFGNHPGMDRFPREAVLCGCCVLTGKRGAAKNKVDVPISDKYKFDEIDESQIYRIIEMINYIGNNYEIVKHDYDQYREIVKSQKTQFIEDALTIFG